MPVERHLASARSTWIACKCMTPTCGRRGTCNATISNCHSQMQAGEGEGETKKLWGGRFTGATDPLMEKFNESLPFDKRMWAEDIRVRP